MKKVQGTKLFLALLLTTSFIFSFSQFGAKAYDHFFQPSSGYKPNTNIASIDAAGMNESDVLKVLVAKQAEWVKTTAITVKYKEKTKKIDNHLFVFRLRESVSQMKSGVQNDVLVMMDEEKWQSFLQSISPEIVKEDSFYLNKLQDNLLAIAASFQTGDSLIDISDYKVSKQEDEKVLSETVLAVEGQEKAIKKWIKTFPSFEITPQSSLSLLKTVEDAGDHSYTNETLSMVATAMHSVILASNFPVTERYISSVLPSFAQLGYEARVNKEKKMDYRFYNPNDESYKLHFKLVDQKLYVSLTGASFLYQYKVVLADKESFKPKTTIQFDAKLSFGEYKTVSEGKDGQLIKVYRKILDDKGETNKKELVSEDFYPPINKVIVSSLFARNSVSNNPQSDETTTEPNSSQDETTETNAGNDVDDQTSSENKDSTSANEDVKEGQQTTQEDDQDSSVPEVEK